MTPPIDSCRGSLIRRFTAVRRAGEAGEPTRSGVFFDDTFAHGFAKGFVNTLDLTGRGLVIFRLNGEPSFFHQRAQFRLNFDVARAPFDTLPVAFFD